MVNSNNTNNNALRMLRLPALEERRRTFVTLRRDVFSAVVGTESRFELFRQSGGL